MSLNKILKPKSEYDLIRIGNKFDGGYLSTKKNLEKTDLLISFGIFLDWKFEKEFLKLTNSKMIAVDDNLDLFFFLKTLYKDIGRFLFKLDFKSIFINIFKLVDYILFFNKKNLIKFSVDYNFLNNLLKNLDYKNIFIKIDIEGSEYRVLNEILENKDKINVIIIEFHDLDLHIEKVINFTKKLNFEITHIHPNNIGGIDKDGNPKVVEITYEKNPLAISSVVSLPNKKDYPNEPMIEDIFLNFTD